MRALVVGFLMCLGLAVAAPAPAAAAPPDTQEETRAPRASFWGSNAPAKGGAYRWRLLGIGVALLGVTGIVMLRLVRRAKDERAVHASSRYWR